jgi:SAM-dependent methyltransferase
MVGIARRKKEDAGAERLELEYVVSDIADLSLGRRFDAAIMMFNVIGYLAEPKQRLRAVAAVREHLRPGGPFVFDYWHGPAVLASPPAETFREIPIEGGQLLRGASTDFDPEQRLCDVTMSVWRIEGDRVAGRTSERHRVRFYDEAELSDLLGGSGFDLIRTAAFSDPRRPPTPPEWQAVGIAVAAS